MDRRRATANQKKKKREREKNGNRNAGCVVCFANSILHIAVLV